MAVVGFDVGNENSYIAAVKSGGIEILDNEYSLRSTPTYVAFTENSRDIGVTAKSKLITNLENTVFGFKRILAKKHGDSEAENELAYLPHTICELSSGDIGIKVNYLKNSVVFSVEQLMAMMLTKLKMVSESKLGGKIRDCVIAVPAYYTDVQRRAMLDAVSIAGLSALKLINESTAVALSYGYFKQNLPEHEYQNVLFVDVGSSSVTATACAFSKDKCKILGCVWDNVGGRDFDNVLVQYFISDFKNRYQLDVATSKKALMTLLLECESLKKLMSANSLEVQFQIECFMQDTDVNGKMKRDVFESLSTHVFNRIERTLFSILNETRLNPNDIYSVELVGGSSRIPAVKHLIQKVFNQEPKFTLNQDEAVVRGCALQCALLSPSLKTRNFTIDDMPSYSIKILWKNMECKDEELEIFSRCDGVPAFKMITLCMSKPFTLAAFNVDSHSKGCKIGSFTFGNVPQDADEYGFIKIKVKACLDINAVFTLISAKMIVKNGENDRNDKISTDKNLDENIDLDSQNASVQDENVKSPSIIKSHDLTIISDPPCFSKAKVDDFIKAEQQMISKDIREKERADARNALEECIYDIRGKLSYELRDFMQEEDRSKLLQSLYETQNWLYDSEVLEVVEYKKRLEEYNHLYDPIWKRYIEWEERPVVLDECSQTLQRSFDIINNIKSIEKYQNTSSEEIDNLRSMWQNLKQYLDQAKEMFTKLEKYHDVPLTVDDLKKSLMRFKEEFQNALSELEKRVSTPNKSPRLSCGDGNSHDSESSPNNKSNLQEDIKSNQFT